MSVRILIGDCRVRMAELPDASVDSVVCDPPYELGFMSKAWDSTGVANDPAMWRQVLRVLKPGGHLLAFSGTRTYHRMVCAIEGAGFEIRDQLAWVFGAGFPKSHNLDKALGDENRCLCGAETLPERDLRLVRDADVPAPVNAGEECGEALFPLVPEQGSSGAVLRPEPTQGDADASQPGVEGRRDPEATEGELQRGSLCESSGLGTADGAKRPLHHGASVGDGSNVRLPADALGSGEPQGSQPGEQSPVEPGAVADERGSQARGSWPICGGCRKPIVPTGYGSALKPAYEPICLARKPLQGTILRNFLTHGTGALNIDGCRIEAPDAPEEVQLSPNAKSRFVGVLNGGKVSEAEPRGFSASQQGRWPANLCHDGSEEVLAGFPAEAGAGQRVREFPQGYDPNGKNEIYGDGLGGGGCRGAHGDSGSAARFFYCAKATTDERGEGNNHPTVKPISLMRWLVRLVTPKGGTVLDPFMGSGSTLLAAEAEQFNAIGCEMSPEYAAIAEGRLKRAGGMFADVVIDRGLDRAA